MSTNPGFARQSQYRTTLRVSGAVILLIGIVTFGYGIVSVFGNDSYDGPGGFQIVCFIGGLLVIGLGIALLQAGFVGAAARYGAGETMPVVKDSASYLSDGQGILGVGRAAGATSPAGAATKTGPFCTKCGVRNDVDARFCDSCGNGLG